MLELVKRGKRERERERKINAGSSGERRTVGVDYATIGSQCKPSDEATQAFGGQSQPVRPTVYG